MPCVSGDLLYANYVNDTLFPSDLTDEWLPVSSVDEVHDASPAAAGQQHKGGTGLVRGPNPAALQITLLTISTGTSQSGRTV